MACRPRARKPLVAAIALFVVGPFVPPNVAAAGGDAPTSQGGAGSPEDVVNEFLESVRLSDPLGVLAMLHPHERTLVDGLYSSASGAAGSTEGIDVDALLQSLRLDVSPGELIVEQLTDRIAWVTTEEATLTVEVDVEAADDAIDGDLSATDFDSFNRDYEPADEDFGIAVVRGEDAWFVSALYTAAEIGRRTLDLPETFATGVPVPAKSATPTEALTGLLAALSSKDVTAAAGALPEFEAQLIADYQATIGAEWLEALEDYALSFDAQNVDVIAEDETRAVLEVNRWSFEASAEDNSDLYLDTSLEVEGTCGALRTYDTDDEEYDDDESCLFDESIGYFDVFSVLQDDGWNGPRFVTVNENGAWSVSLLHSVLYSLLPLTGDPVTAASLFQIPLALPDSDAYYEVVFAVLGAAAPTLASGENVVPPTGNGRVGIFHVSDPAALDVAVAGADPDGCYVFLVYGEDEDGGGEQDVFDCDESYIMSEDNVVGVVSTSEGVLSGPAPIGEVRVTVTPE